MQQNHTFSITNNQQCYIRLLDLASDSPLPHANAHHFNDWYVALRCKKTLPLKALSRLASILYNTGVCMRASYRLKVLEHSPVIGFADGCTIYWELHTCSKSVAAHASNKSATTSVHSHYCLNNFLQLAAAKKSIITQIEADWLANVCSTCFAAIFRIVGLSTSYRHFPTVPAPKSCPDCDVWMQDVTEIGIV